MGWLGSQAGSPCVHVTDGTLSPGEAWHSLRQAVRPCSSPQGAARTRAAPTLTSHIRGTTTGGHRADMPSNATLGQNQQKREHTCTGKGERSRIPKAPTESHPHGQGRSVHPT